MESRKKIFEQVHRLYPAASEEQIIREISTLEAMNPSNIFLKRGGTQYRLHDKVMQVRNDYDKEVFNGDIGIIAQVDTEDGELTVNFDDREVTYDVTELDEQGRILLELRTDNHCWGYPGGSVELDEAVEDAARRELFARE